MAPLVHSTNGNERQEAEIATHRLPTPIGPFRKLAMSVLSF
jgi:hypothetical protein